MLMMAVPARTTMVPNSSRRPGTFEHIDNARRRIRHELDSGDGKTTLRDVLVFAVLFGGTILAYSLL